MLADAHMFWRAYELSVTTRIFWFLEVKALLLTAAASYLLAVVRQHMVTVTIFFPLGGCIQMFGFVLEHTTG